MCLRWKHTKSGVRGQTRKFAATMRCMSQSRGGARQCPQRWRPLSESTVIVLTAQCYATAIYVCVTGRVYICTYFILFCKKKNKKTLLALA